MTTTEAIRPQDTLADLAATRPGASRVFHRHGLDFCCHGNVSLAQACASRLDPAEVAAEIEAEARSDGNFERWDEKPLAALIEHVLARFHEPHREELPRLVQMARKVEAVHADKPDCPHGLTEVLEGLAEELELHMQKEEQVLFPLVLGGRGRMARVPIQVMEQEHEDAGAALARLRELTGDYRPPADACGTWTALYLGLEELELELMRHIHLENNVLFPRALQS